MIKELEKFPVQMEIPVAWGEMDAFQHVNNLVYLRYFESARMSYMEACGFQQMMVEQQLGPILRDSSIRYRIPLTYPDRVISATRVISVSTDRFDMEHVVYSFEHQKIAAEGKATIVAVDYQKNCKAALPEVVRDTFLQLEPERPILLDV